MRALGSIQARRLDHYSEWSLTIGPINTTLLLINAVAPDTTVTDLLSAVSLWAALVCANTLMPLFTSVKSP